MKSPSSESDAADAAAIRDAAARWVVRHDRRLSPAETLEWEAWLAADPRHAAAYESSAASWQRFRQIGSAVRRAPIATEGSFTPWKWSALGSLAAAAALALAFYSSNEAARPAAADANRPSNLIRDSAAPAIRHLADGSLAQLRADAEIAEAFTATERRLRLVRGEAFFAVAKDATRPFLVEVGHVTVRAVGTAFSIRFEPQAVDVVVTEGTVRVTPPVLEFVPPGASAPVADHSALVRAGHRAVVAPNSGPNRPPVVVSRVPAEELARRLAWSGSMLELGGATLGELVETFTQRTGRRFEIAEPALAAVRIGGRFPTGDSDGFVRVLREIYGVDSEKRPDGTIVLRQAR